MPIIKQTEINVKSSFHVQIIIAGCLSTLGIFHTKQEAIDILQEQSVPRESGFQITEQRVILRGKIK